MGSAFIPQPEEYWIPNPLDPQGERIPTMNFVQFVPGVVESVVLGKDSGNWAGDNARIGSILAMPHYGNNIKKGTVCGEECRYYPLIRGVTETPVQGDPVLLTNIGGKQYYLGPLNTQNQVNYNKDNFKGSQRTSGYETGRKSIGRPVLFEEMYVSKLEKQMNPTLDSPHNPNVSFTNEQHGDMIFEGRHGNSLRIGSRNINPYIIISNKRNPELGIESTMDGTILGIFSHGSIRTHFNNEWITKNKEEISEEMKKEFFLADETLGEYPDYSNVKRSIKKTLASSMGRGLGPNEDSQPNATGKDDPDVEDTIYGYEENQFFLSSDRITFNARNEDMFLSARQFLHFGAGNNINFSTSNTFLLNAATSTVINSPLFKVEAQKVYIDGINPKYTGKEASRKDEMVGSIFLGNPLKDDTMHKAVCGDALVLVLSSLIQEVSALASETAQAIENRANYGGSVKIMRAVSERLDQILGLEEGVNPLTQESQVVAKGLSDNILSNHVRIKQ
tara:strand:- start:1503 stop:3017 length:1515 start_codon:yes stop_codon:yes gene_type:complete